MMWSMYLDGVPWGFAENEAQALDWIEWMIHQAEVEGITTVRLCAVKLPVEFGGFIVMGGFS